MRRELSAICGARGGEDSAFCREKDNELVEKQLAAIDELLSPRLQFALMLEFVQYERETRLLDPVVANWLELEPGEVDGMKRRIATARSFLQQHLGPNSTPFACLPDDLDKEYRHLRERILSDLPAQKIIRCLRVCGYIGADERLTAFLERYPDRAEYVTAEVSAFHIAKMQMEADAEKDDAKNR